MFNYRRKSFSRKILDALITNKIVKIIVLGIVALGAWTAKEEEGRLSTLFKDCFEEVDTSSEGDGHQPYLAASDYDFLIQHTGFTVSYDTNTNTPKWVAWELTKEKTYGVIKRTDEFLPDPAVDIRNRVTTEDYKGSGYDRGHICPAADMKWSVDAMRDCFYMTNICPQNHNLNRKAWEVLEEQCRQWAREYGKIYITSGPIYEVGNHKVIGKNNNIIVPEAFYKVVMVPIKGKEKAIGFYYRNEAGKQTIRKCALTVDMIEKITGINFFYNVDERIQDRIEAECDIESWL